MGTAASPATAAKRRSKTPNLNHSTYYLNRELSWIQFNARVLEEALDGGNPLLERAKFLSIFSSNLDEFFMIRVAGLRRQLAGGALAAPPDGMTPAEQLAAVRERLIPLLGQQTDCWHEDLRPKLDAACIHVISYSDLKPKERKKLRRFFKDEIFPALTPLAFDPGHPFPHISNLSINLAVVVIDPERGERFARVKVPHRLPRFVPVKREKNGAEFETLGLAEKGAQTFVWLEEVVLDNLDLLFPGLGIAAAYPFRVTRDADMEIEEDEASDLMSTMEEMVGQRHFGFAVRLEVDSQMPEDLQEILTTNLSLAPYQVYSLKTPLGLSDLMELCNLDRPDLKDTPFLPVHPPALMTEENIFSILKRRDILLYHPYDSFNPVVDFVQQAARDPKVLAIKQTLYRVGPNSPIVSALSEARENGIQVSALVELKARFDEANNIVWARALEDAGVHVVYGLVGLKTHAKMCLVVRRERSGIKCYVHLGTGNYNPVTARMYTDLGYLTSNPDLASDVSDLFNALTGYSRQDQHRKLLVAPGQMRKQMVKRIHREIEHHKKHGKGHLAFKLNSLVDKACIKALYQASIAGVRVDLQIRGICCLEPGAPRVSENITVTSVVGRFLEHTRVFYFRNGGEEEILIGSADLMPRNLDGRVEILFPLEDPHLIHMVRDEILFLHLQDNIKCRRLRPDGEYERLTAPKGTRAIDSQAIRLGERGSWHTEPEE